MKVYIVSADTYGGGWGAEIFVFAVCDSLTKAQEEREKVNGYSTITEMELNEFKPVYLGGYIE